MENREILNRLAPCGLHCGKCFAFANGDIAKHSSELQKSLGNFDIYAQRFVELLNEPAFCKYPEFKEMLSVLAEGTCNGCRKEHCKLFKSCNVRTCAEKKKVDFCFQCNDFPCDQTGFDDHLYERSVNINIHMREIGIESYFNEVKDKPRY